MITVQIGTDQRVGIDERWINQQINARRRAGERVCVQVRIETSSIHISLATPACGGGGGGAPPRNDGQRSILDLWIKHRLDQDDFTGGNLIAFLKQVS